MGYELHIEKPMGADSIQIEGWKRAIEQTEGVRLASGPWTAKNPGTGETISIKWGDGDAEVLVAGEWVPVFTSAA